MPISAVPDVVEINSLRGRYPDTVVNLLDALDSRVRACVTRCYDHRLWRTFADPSTSNAMAISIVRELLKTVAAYQPHTTEAGFLMLGRLPKGDQSLLRALFNHKIEEAEHGHWARADVTRLGGASPDERAPLTPAKMAVVAVWWHMARTEQPIGYLGAEYLFEMLTTVLAAQAVRELQRRGLPLDAFRFVVEHATEDIKHSNLLKFLICEYLVKYPDTAPAMVRCYDYFEQVYPLPVWTEAIETACPETGD